MPKNDNFKGDLLDAIVSAGENTVTSRLSDDSILSRVRFCIPTGSPALDRILAKDADGNYGMPVGRIIGINGKEASGKTTLLITLMKRCQELGGVVRFYETEMAFDPEYAKTCGVNIEEVILTQPDYLEQMLNGILIDVNLFKDMRARYEKKYKEQWDIPMLICVDSIAGSPPKAEYMANDFEKDEAMGLHARKLSKFFRTATKRVATENICLVMTNQTKTDIKVTYGNKDTTIGGRALRFHASIILEMRRAGWIKPTKNAEPIGIMSEVKTSKNKMLIPFRKANVPIIFGKGVEYNMALFEFLLENKIIEKYGSWFELNVGRVRIREHGQKKFVRTLADFTRKKKIRTMLEELAD